jgi:hypothetical protein
MKMSFKICGLMCAAYAGYLVTDSLLGYIKERQAQRERWVTALQTTRVPLRLVNGPADPVSGGMTGLLWAQLFCWFL